MMVDGIVTVPYSRILIRRRQKNKEYVFPEAKSSIAADEASPEYGEK